MPSAQIKAPNAVDIEVGRRIRQRRAILGFTQAALAEHLGITFQQVQKYEKGTNRVGSSRLQTVARFLDVPISYFFDDLETRRSVPLDDATVTVASFLSSGDGLALNRAFLNIKSEKFGGRSSLWSSRLPTTRTMMRATANLRQMCRLDCC